MPGQYLNIKLNSFENFVSFLEEIGFMTLSSNSIGFPYIEILTDRHIWFTGLETDPWIWKTRIVEEKKAVYAKLFNNKHGFISLEWYPQFYSVRRKGNSFEYYNSIGLLSRYEKKIYDLFEDEPVLATHEIKALA